MGGGKLQELLDAVLDLLDAVFVLGLLAGALGLALLGLRLLFLGGEVLDVQAVAVVLLAELCLALQELGKPVFQGLHLGLHGNQVLGKGFRLLLQSVYLQVLFLQVIKSLERLKLSPVGSIRPVHVSHSNPRRKGLVLASRARVVLGPCPG